MSEPMNPSINQSINTSINSWREHTVGEAWTMWSEHGWTSLLCDAKSMLERTDTVSNLQVDARLA